MDSHKSQTSTATPAQQGDFPLWFKRDLSGCLHNLNPVGSLYFPVLLEIPAVISMGVIGEIYAFIVIMAANEKIAVLVS